MSRSLFKEISIQATDWQIVMTKGTPIKGGIRDQFQREPLAPDHRHEVSFKKKLGEGRGQADCSFQLPKP
jgi:hypothetical protein